MAAGDYHVDHPFCPFCPHLADRTQNFQNVHEYRIWSGWVTLINPAGVMSLINSAWLRATRSSPIPPGKWQMDCDKKTKILVSELFPGWEAEREVQRGHFRFDLAVQNATWRRNGFTYRKKGVWFGPGNFSSKCWILRENPSTDGRDSFVYFMYI